MPKRTLEGRVAVVAGGSRGAGRGIAVALGEAGATVYVLGRTVRGGPPPPDGAPGTIEDTAEEVSRRGGTGIAVRADCSVEEEVAAAFDRVEREQKRLDVLANAVWGGHDAFADPQEEMSSWAQPFWQLPIRLWRHMMTEGPYAYFLTSWYAARAMVPRKRGLIVGITDGWAEGMSPDDYGGQLLWDLSHRTMDRLARGMGAETKRHKIAVVSLMPGFMRTERVVAAMTSEKIKKQFRFDLSESTEYVGRAVAALAGDPDVARKSGKVLFVADLAKEYGFTDVDGRSVPRFNPSA